MSEGRDVPKSVESQSSGGPSGGAAPRSGIGGCRAFGLLASLLAGWGVPALGQAVEPLSVAVRVSKAPYYAGQAIALEVGADAAGERPTLRTPKVPGAEVTLLGTDLRPLGPSSIGRLVFERIRYLWKYRIIPRKGGTLVVPSITVHLGERSGTSPSLRLRVEDLPVSGRPAEFLGGVGTFEVRADANPTVVRAGEEIAYRIRITGPAARGSVRAPVLSRFDRLPIGLRVIAEPPESIADPPSRDFRYRLRPSRAGESVLPPVTVSAFDPGTSRYITKSTEGVRVRVVELPRLGPSTLVVESVSSPRRPSGFAWGIVLTLVAIVPAAALFVRRAIDRRRPGRDRRRLLERAGGSLVGPLEETELARRVIEGLASYLELTTGRPRGALTPDEARQGVEVASGSAPLGGRAGLLVADCDRVLFGGEGASQKDLAGSARQLFEDLREGEGRLDGRGLEAEKPREAVETEPS